MSVCQYDSMTVCQHASRPVCQYVSMVLNCPVSQIKLLLW